MKPTPTPPHADPQQDISTWRRAQAYWWYAWGLSWCRWGIYTAEQSFFRAGIRSIRQGQWNAGRALGMGDLQIFLRIVLPQAVMRVLPALATTWVSLFKDTSLVSVIAVADLSYVSLRLRAETYRILEVLTAMAALYWLMGYPQAKLCDWIHRRYRVFE